MTYVDHGLVNVAVIVTRVLGPGRHTGHQTQCEEAETSHQHPPGLTGDQTSGPDVFANVYSLCST